MPLYQLLGGASREKVLCYTHAQGRDIAEAVDAVGKRMEEGYKAIRTQVGIPGLPDVYGTGKKSVTNNAAEDAVRMRKLVDFEISSPCAEALRGGARGARLGYRAAA